MKKKLSDLTLAEFIDMECGDLDVLKSSHEIVAPAKLLECRERLSHEFQSIASPASFKSMICDRERKTKMRAKAMLFNTLKSMIEIEAFDDVRKLLSLYGHDPGGRDDEWVARHVTSQLNAATFELKRMGIEVPKTEDATPDEIRKGYEGMVADLMIANKMSIDIYTIRASVFASMVYKANEMARVMNSKIKSRK